MDNNNETEITEIDDFNVYGMDKDPVMLMGKVFANKYNIKLGRERVYIGDNKWRVKPYNLNDLYFHYEWTDGDQLTFFITKPIKRDDYLDWEIVCSASVDDWENDRPRLMYQRLLNASINAGIIQSC